jgi:hypothetical protein
VTWEKTMDLNEEEEYRRNERQNIESKKNN